MAAVMPAVVAAVPTGLIYHLTELSGLVDHRATQRARPKWVSSLAE